MEPAVDEAFEERYPGASAEARALARKLDHLLEPAIRWHLVRERLRELEPRLAVGLLALVLREAAASTRLRDLREIVHDLLLSHPDGTPSGLDYDFRRDVYRAAREADEEDVLEILRSTPAAQAGGGDRRLPPDLVEVPLGMRRSLAKNADAHWLELLALDPDPIVIRNLLRNSRMRENEVVRIAALRPVSAQTLHEIATSPRWNRSVAVRRAIARNPHSPADLAIKQLVSLPLSDLREMQRDPDLHPETQKQLLRELERRSR